MAHPSKSTGTPALSLPLFRGTPHACPYLPGRTATYEFTLTPALDAGDYQQLMDRGFRRSGSCVYRPVCGDCRECIPIRIPVERFRRSRSQRRVWRRNPDVHVETGPPRLTDEKLAVYQAYLAFQHGASALQDPDDLEQFLYRSPTSTEEMVYRAAGRLLAVGVVDVCPHALSSVYFYFDPAQAWRSPGVLGALHEIEACRRRGLAYWYVGYYVRDCAKMNYKTAFRPYELFGPDGRWREPQLPTD